MGLEEKTEKLKKELRALAETDVIVAFSGGADSSLLLTMACEAAKEQHTKVYAILMETTLMPEEDLENLRQMAKERGAAFLAIQADPLWEAGIEDNPVDRCYRCKKYLFQKMLEKGKELGAPTLMEGSNADDRNVYRPGLKAIRELGVHSPLAKAGLTKAEVRQLGRRYGVKAADQPSAPCLATRFPYGTRLTKEELRKVEEGEAFLKTFCPKNVRLRVHTDVARIETDTEAFPVILEHAEEIASYLKALGYTYVTLDLDGFTSGSMDRKIEDL